MASSTISLSLLPHILSHKLSNSSLPTTIQLSFTRLSMHVPFGGDRERPAIQIEEEELGYRFNRRTLRRMRAGRGSRDLDVILLKEGVAKLYSVGTSATKLFAKIEAATNHKSGMNKLSKKVFQAFTKYVDFSVVHCVLIGSKGSIKNELRRYLLLESQKSKMKSIQENKSRIVVVHTSRKNSLKNVLNDLTILSMIKDTNASIEIRVFKEFSDALNNDCDHTCYGLKSVEAAQEMMTIETLLVINEYSKSETCK